MNHFIKKLANFSIILFCLIVLLIFIANYSIAKKTFSPGESEANLWYIKKDFIYDYLILGISHGRSISRNNHHQIFENAFKSKMINLSQGNALGGLENQMWYLDYFLKKGNKAKNLILVLSPTLMFSNQIDNNSTAFYAEPIKFDFISHILVKGGDNKYGQVFHYIKSKLSHHWWNQKPNSTKENLNVLAKADSNVIKEGLRIGYPSGLNQMVFKERKKIFASIIKKAIENNITPIVIIPPAIFGQWPGHDLITNYLEQNFADLMVINSSELSRDLTDYYDHHHLNTKGMTKWIDELHFKISNK